MLYLCDQCDIFIFSLLFIAIDHITSLTQMHFLLYIHFLQYLLLFLDAILDEESK